MHERDFLRWKILAGLSLISSDLYVIFHGFHIETPVLNFPFLSLLHSLAILVVLPTVFLNRLPLTAVSGRGMALVIIGGITLILGFSFVPRSLVVAESGLMILLGGRVLQKILPSDFLYDKTRLERLLFWGFLLTVLTGILLGLTLARPSIDPIPFRGILLHGLMGIAFTLTASSVFLSVPDRNKQSPLKRRSLTALLYLAGIACLFVIPMTPEILSWVIISMSLLLLALLLEYRSFRSHSMTGTFLLTGAILLLSGSGWKETPGPSMTFLLLAWLYLLAGSSFCSEKSGKTAGMAGSLLILSGIWGSDRALLYAGFLIHSVTALAFAILPALRERKPLTTEDSNL